MEALKLLVEVILALGLVAFVGYPLLRELGDEEAVAVPEELQDLYARKESTYSALKELEFDYKTGKLSEVDFRELDAKYRHEAIELLEAIDLLEKGEEPKPRGKRKAEQAAAVPATTARQRGTGRPAAGGSGARATGNGRAKVGQGRTCPECDAENPTHARFCGSCGEALPEEAPAKRARKVAGGEQLVCAECGATVAPEHRFCAGCGAEVGA
jgi:hypothetical protein